MDRLSKCLVCFLFAIYDMNNIYISMWMCYMEKYEHGWLCIGFPFACEYDNAMNIERHVCMYVCKCNVLVYMCM